MPFKPRINSHSAKIARQQSEQLLRDLRRVVPGADHAEVLLQKGLKTKERLRTRVEMKREKGEEECTFKPYTNNYVAEPAESKTSSERRSNDRIRHPPSAVFEELYKKRKVPSQKSQVRLLGEEELPDEESEPVSKNEKRISVPRSPKERRGTEKRRGELGEKKSPEQSKGSVEGPGKLGRSLGNGIEKQRRAERKIAAGQEEAYDKNLDAGGLLGKVLFATEPDMEESPEKVD